MIFIPIFLNYTLQNYISYIFYYYYLFIYWYSIQLKFMLRKNAFNKNDFLVGKFTPCVF